MSYQTRTATLKHNNLNTNSTSVSEFTSVDPLDLESILLSTIPISCALSFGFSSIKQLLTYLKKTEQFYNFNSLSSVPIFFSNESENKYFDVHTLETKSYKAGIFHYIDNANNDNCIPSNIYSEMQKIFNEIAQGYQEEKYQTRASQALNEIEQIQKILSFSRRSNLTNLQNTLQSRLENNITDLHNNSNHTDVLTRMNSNASNDSAYDTFNRSAKEDLYI